MALQDNKYKSLVELATREGVRNLEVREQDGVLYIDGIAPSSAAKDAIWDHYETLNPEFRDSDLIMNLSLAEGAEEVYVVKSGDNLSKIAKKYPGLSWKDIYEANTERIKNPDLIQPGWELKIPRK
ncbi:LysM peptidoglycan-binding domain-containing protein [Flavihumibacter sp. CACIAM 22H1]|uniref:LysM peptidoglycan-binding domain-containing protein n=1 Tax=Flavihumibacter sp. CACIAM 22H1 TaxID=1812911 RepID=UPI0007A88290|nr:LysM peptidoglycan-binding domain-containing protein [Flavihumibacter sp. CACIAM 22H1]KYP15697.1 MAG: peptidoglycan-binding protein [Flavihumibacter sp. CACIAM 22H1]